MKVLWTLFAENQLESNYILPLCDTVKAIK